MESLSVFECICTAETIQLCQYERNLQQPVCCQGGDGLYSEAGTVVLNMKKCGPQCLMKLR